METDSDGSSSCELIERVALLCSRSLEVWHGSIYINIAPERLAQAFARFEKLHTIRLNDLVIGNSSPETYSLVLAHSCLKLRTVIVTPRAANKQADHTWISISRKGSLPTISSIERIDS